MFCHNAFEQGNLESQHYISTLAYYYYRQCSKDLIYKLNREKSLTHATSCLWQKAAVRYKKIYIYIIYNYNVLQLNIQINDNYLYCNAGSYYYF